MPENRFYTVFVVPERGSKSRKLTVTRKALVRAAWAFGITLALLVAAAIHYSQIVGRARENAGLREENLGLKGNLRFAEAKVGQINETLSRIKHLNANLQNITALNDPERQLAIAPPPRAEDPDHLTGEGGPIPDETEVDTVALASDLNRLDKESVKEEKTLSALRDYFEDQKTLLASAPSIWPVRGWVTSDFGARLDPYTEERAMHQGLDIATAKGTPVKAPADGVVIFGGYEGPGYGNVIVIDHGYGVKTRHGHLEDVFVKVGEKIKRGHVIGAVGNTGRSTGPHLHYEVRINGIPENPRKFILQE